MLGLQRIETDAQRVLFFSFAVVPRATLQAHDQHVIADKVGLVACL